MTARFIKTRTPHQLLSTHKSHIPAILVGLSAIMLCAASVRAQPQIDSKILAAPQLPPFKWFASTDPKRRNADYILLKPGETRRVPLASGKLLRLWSTASQPEKIVLHLVGGPNFILLSDNSIQVGELYQKAFTLYPTEKTRFLRDLKNSAALVVSNRDTKPNKWFYQVAIRAAETKTLPAAKSGTQAKPAQTIAPGAEAAILSATQPGTLRILTLDIKNASPQTFKDLRLRATWDKDATRAVDVPLSAFAAQFFSTQSVQSAGWNLDTNDSSFNITFPMPFGAGAKVSLLNNGETSVQISAESKIEETTSAYRFCAHYGSSRTQNGKPVQMLNVSGEGSFVGLNLGISPTKESGRQAFAYLEGNEIITADGRDYEGTGAEDFFNSAWYFPDESFARPYHGMTKKNKLPPQVSAYRLMIDDAVPFRKSLNFTFGHGSSNRGDDLEYQWVAFWYQKSPLKFEVPDTLNSSTQSAVESNADSSGARAVPFGVFIWMAPVVIIIVFMVRSRRRKTS